MRARHKTKEQIYDSQISPLMARIISTCKRHKIPVVACFGLGPDDNGDLHCTTAIVPEEFEPSEMLLELKERIYPTPRSPLMVTTRDGEGNITRMDAIL